MAAGSPAAAITAWITVGTSSLLAGADKITKCAPASMCFARSSRFLNTPVHSNTRSTPISRQGNLAGSFALKMGILLAIDLQAVVAGGDCPKRSTINSVVSEQISKGHRRESSHLPQRDRRPACRAESLAWRARFGRAHWSLNIFSSTSHAQIFCNADIRDRLMFSRTELEPRCCGGSKFCTFAECGARVLTISSGDLRCDCPKKLIDPVRTSQIHRKAWGPPSVRTQPRSHRSGASS